MQRDENVLELGTASCETKGPIGPIADFKNGMLQAGLNND